MAKRDITNIRSTLEFLEEQNRLLRVTKEVDIMYEIAAIQKAFEEGPALLFENIKGYPQARDVANVAVRGDVIARVLDVPDPRKIKFKYLDAIKNPMPPEVIETGPCQECVITENIDVVATLPIIKHTEEDAGRILGSGIVLACGRYFQNGSDLAFKRMHFRGKDWASMALTLGSHLEQITSNHRGEKIPLTVNITPPPAVMLAAGGGAIHSVIPFGTDELGIAGGLQGSPVEICPARTVDAYSIAQSEWVIEGYLDTTQTVWESEQSEKAAAAGKELAPFFPEYSGYFGLSRKSYKFQATAITHRRDRPIFYTPLANSFENVCLGKGIKEACLYEIANRIAPGFVTDVNILPGQKSWGGAVFQVHKRRHWDEGLQKRILRAVLAEASALAVAIVTDEDVNIYSADDVIWALTTRLNPVTGIVGGGAMPSRAGTAVFAVEEPSSAQGLGFDATIPYAARSEFKLGRYPVGRIDLRKWFSEKEIASVRNLQSDYARILAERGW